jgi:hypothetical protein
MELERHGQQKQQRLGEVVVKNTNVNMWFNDFLICSGTFFFPPRGFSSQKKWKKILTTERFFPEYLAYVVINSTIRYPGFGSFIFFFLLFFSSLFYDKGCKR